MLLKGVTLIQGQRHRRRRRPPPPPPPPHHHYHPEFLLVLKSRGPRTSSSMNLGLLFAFQGSPDYYRSLVFFFQFLCLVSKRLSHVICSHNYIFSRLTKLTLLY